MNKQEAIERIKNLYSFIMEDEPFEVGLINKNQVLDIISQIDEPKKVTVPKFVAEWIEKYKKQGKTLYMAMDAIHYSIHPCRDWFETNQDTFARAWLDGYTVEKEKLYTVEIPDPHGLYKIRYLFRNSVGNIRIGGNDYRDIFLNAETHLTEAEIKKDFEWAWNAGFAKEVE